MKKIIISILAVGISLTAQAQSVTPTQTQIIDSLKIVIENRDSTILEKYELLRQTREVNKIYETNNSERVQFGLSFAYSQIWKNQKKYYTQPYISSADSNLYFESLEGNFVLLSTTLSVTPFLHADWIKVKRAQAKKLNNKRNRSTRIFLLWLLENSGVAVNINFLEFATGNKQNSFNSSVEGGLGYSLRLSKNIYISLSNELKFHRTLNSAFKAGQPLYYEGNVISDISQIPVDNDNFYHTRPLIHWSSRIIVDF